jgi:hypothetical protein
VLENTAIGLYNDCAMVAEPTRAEMLQAIESFLEARQQTLQRVELFHRARRFRWPANLPGLQIACQDTRRTMTR